MKYYFANSYSKRIRCGFETRLIRSETDCLSVLACSMLAVISCRFVDNAGFPSTVAGGRIEFLVCTGKGIYIWGEFWQKYVNFERDFVKKQSVKIHENMNFTTCITDRAAKITRYDTLM